MEIGKNSWHYKLFRFSVYVNKWFGSNIKSINLLESNQVDLCVYLRSILLWLPLNMFLYVVATWCVLKLVLFEHALLWAGVIGSGVFILTICAIVAVAATCIFVDRQINHGATGAKFSELVATMSKVKNKFCPILKVK